MPVLDPARLAEWCGGSWTRLPAASPNAVVHDTRALGPGALYVALPGERVDGHSLIDKAFSAGALAALCERGKADARFPCLAVDDTGLALQQIAKGYRQTLLPQRMIGVTGSAGKTTVKDLLASLFAEAGPTCRTRGNWNNFIGLPLSLLSMEASDAFGVFELGMNRGGEIAALSEILQPEMGLITSIGEAHLENLGSVSAIAQEKGCLLAALPKTGMAVLDQDAPWYHVLKARCQCRWVTVSVQDEADYRGRWLGERLEVYDRDQNETFTVSLPLPGAHMVGNVLQAVAMARVCGLRATQIQQGLEKYTPAPMRWQSRQISGWQVINDAYNANPLRMRKSIQTLAEMKVVGQKWLVLGGMAELGKEEQALHRLIGEELDGLGFDGVILVGEKSVWIGEGMRQTPFTLASTHEAAALSMQKQIPEAAVVLLKGSRSAQLELILQKLQNPEEGPL